MEAPIPEFPGPLLLDQCTDARGALLHEPGRSLAIATAPMLWQRRFQPVCDRTPLPAVVLLAARWSAVVRTERSHRMGTSRWRVTQ